MGKAQSAVETATVQEPLLDKELTRKKFLFKQISIPEQIATQSITFWEELTCVGYNPRERRLEGIVSIKQPTGYSGGLCNPSSKEYVRFFMDFKDGSGFHDMGYTSFKACDIPNAPSGQQHPLMYMTNVYINDEKYRKFLDCNKAVIPEVKGILSWNMIPPSNPNYIPFYGNVKNVSVQIPRKSIVILKELLDTLKVKPEVDGFGLLPQQQSVHLPPPPPPPVEDIYRSNKATGVPDQRTFYSTIAPLVDNKANFAKASPFNFKEVSKLNLNLENIVDQFLDENNKANVTFEQLNCIGLNTAADTLGAVIHIKKSSGFNGDLCHKGSMENVAFWADWNNDGVFDEYLGTVSVEVHDITNIPSDGLFYNVALPINTNKHLRKCVNPNIIKVRAVLSWESLPSTTDPDHLNYWGNRVDATVQLRPGSSTGVQGKLTFVGSVDRDDIDPFNFLYNYNASFPGIDNNRPWGGMVKFQGIIDRNGFSGTIKYRILYKKLGAPDSDYTTLSTHETFQMFNFNTFTEFNDTQDSPDGWFEYKQNPAIGLYNETNTLVDWNTGGLSDGAYTIKFVFTDESGIEQIGDEFSMIINNQPMTVSPTANATVNINFDMDDVIDGGDCHGYNKSNPTINGHIRAIHPYFGSWSLTLEPSTHAHGTTPIPGGRTYNSLGDTGDANAPWTLNTTPLDPCGYTASLLAYTRVIRNNSTNYPQYGPKAVGFAVLS